MDLLFSWERKDGGLMPSIQALVTFLTVAAKLSPLFGWQSQEILTLFQRVQQRIVASFKTKSLLVLGKVLFTPT